MNSSLSNSTTDSSFDINESPVRTSEKRLPKFMPDKYNTEQIHINTYDKTESEYPYSYILNRSLSSNRNLNIKLPCQDLSKETNFQNDLKDRSFMESYLCYEIPCGEE